MKILKIILVFFFMNLSLSAIHPSIVKAESNDQKLSRIKSEKKDLKRLSEKIYKNIPVSANPEKELKRLQAIESELKSKNKEIGKVIKIKQKQKIKQNKKKSQVMSSPKSTETNSDKLSKPVHPKKKTNFKHMLIFTVIGAICYFGLGYLIDAFSPNPSSSSTPYARHISNNGNSDGRLPDEYT